MLIYRSTSTNPLTGPDYLILHVRLIKSFENCKDKNLCFFCFKNILESENGSVDVKRKKFDIFTSCRNRILDAGIIRAVSLKIKLKSYL